MIMKKLLAVFTALSLWVMPAFAENTADEAAEKTFSAYQQENIIRDYAHFIADSYFYGVSDTNLLYSVICSAIENGGKFDLDRAFEAMLDILNDEYAEFYSPEDYERTTGYYVGSFYGIGVVMRPQSGSTFVDSVYTGSGAEAAGIKAGDKFLAVDGADVSALTAAQIRELIIGEEGTTVAITLERGGSSFTVYPVRAKVSESHSQMSVDGNNAAYIKVSSFTGSLPEEFDAYIAELKSKAVTDVIIDLRDNGGGDLEAAIAVAKKLIPAGLIGIVKTNRDGAAVEEIRSETIGAPNFDILVLVNENTASAGEFLAMALQCSGRARLMGVNTYGKGCMQVMMRTPTGSGIKFTVGEYFTPKGERIHTIGLKPDIEVENIVTPINPDDFAQIDFMNLESEETRLGVEQRLSAVRLISEDEADGVFDSATEAAIRVFQRYGELEETGVLDFYTALKINDYEYDGLTKVTDVQLEEAYKYFKK